MTTIVSLIGEQNLPNLLPILYLKPKQVLLVYTDRTQKTAERLTRLIKDKAEVAHVPTAAYDIDQTRNNILATVQPFLSSDILVNITGGTKVMSLAAYQAAIELNAPIFYLQSEGKKTLLYLYTPENGRYLLPKTAEIPSLITIDDYLHAYVDDYQIVGLRGNPADKGRLFEQAIVNALAPDVAEIQSGIRLLGALEIDFAVRCGNQVAIIEAKTGSAFKKAIDQLNTAGGKNYLGTYTGKFLISDQVWDQKSNLKQLADARQITVVELPSFGQQSVLSPADIHKLQSVIRSALGCAG